MLDIASVAMYPSEVSPFSCATSTVVKSVKDTNMIKAIHPTSANEIALMASEGMSERLFLIRLVLTAYPRQAITIRKLEAALEENNAEETDIQ